MVGELTKHVHILQCKFFSNGIGKSQKSQIRESFRTARKNCDKMKEWTLFLPMDLSRSEREWWEDWVEGIHEEDDIPITLCEGSNLLAELKKYGLYDEYFDVTLQRTLDEILEKLTPLARIEEAVTALSRDSISRIATILDADTVNAAAKACTEKDVDNF